MESIEELRKICQTTAKRDISNVYMRYVSRFFSIYLTRALLPTSVTPNQVSFAMIVTGICACLFFLSSSKWVFLFGALLLQFWYILDCMDGEVARYRHYKATGSVVIRKEESGLTGTYYDIINHYIINLLVPITVSIGVFHATGQEFYLLLGIAGSVGQVLLLAMHDGWNRVLVAHLKKYSRVAIQKKEEQTVKPQRHPLHEAFSWVHYSVTYPTVMNLVLLAAILDCRAHLVVYLALASGVVSAAFITRAISQRTLEHEFKQTFIDLEKEG